MKKTKAVACAAALSIGAAAFAQTSNTNQATAGLIDDNLVDQLDVGVEGADGLFFGGYNTEKKAVELGAGHTGGGMVFTL